MDYETLNTTRRAHRSYVPDLVAPNQVLEHLLNQAALAPSAFNQQGWHVVAVTTPSEKEKMYKQACQQPQVLSSSAMLIVCGNLEQYKNLPDILSKTPSMDEPLRTRIAADAKQAAISNEQYARDEAIRSASLFAMNFMLAATNAGFGTGPMIGFDSEKMCEAFDIRKPYFPAILISFGTVKDAPFPQGYRRPAREFTRFV